jgi:uncharacterized protein (DUF488 family)
MIYTLGLSEFEKVGRGLYALRSFVESEDVVVYDIRLAPVCYSEDDKFFANMTRAESLKKILKRRYKTLREMGAKNIRAKSVVMTTGSDNELLSFPPHYYDIAGALDALVAAIRHDTSPLLLCSCATLDVCHRQHAASLVSGKTGVDIVHLHAREIERNYHAKSIR